MSAATPSPSSRWILDFEKQVIRGKHVLLYGNVHDQFLRDGRYMRAVDFLPAFFRDRGFPVVVRYDPVDGFSFADPAMRPAFEAACRPAGAAGDPGLSVPGAPAPLATPGPPGPAPAPGAPPPRGRPAPPQGAADRLPPEEALARVRLALSQDATPVAVIVDIADMLTSDAERYDQREREVLVRLKKCTLEAVMLRQGPLAGYRNTLVVTAGELARVPEWLHKENPFVALVQATRPGKDERRQFAAAFLPGFFGGERVPAADRPAFCEELADHTDGMQAWDLEALRRTSHAERLDVSPRGGLRRLVDFFKFGLRDDPWAELRRDRVAGAAAQLSRRVIGQPAAVEAVTGMLLTARVGVSVNPSTAGGGKPKGVFFFVGPTGVGKTELAKALTELVFGDERAFARFDMSEYREEHAAEKLGGAPPGFVGYDEGGQLTNRVIERPHSILLFDEIEKAHPRVLDKFLQILEDGRLTDGKGQTAYFHQTAIVFTSNIGASDLTDPTTGTVVRPGILRRLEGRDVAGVPYEEIAAHFQEEVRWYFTSRIGRAELLNRLGDAVVPFDVLRPEHVAAISEKFLRILRDSARERLELELRFDSSVARGLEARMREGDNLLFGGRRVKTTVETLIERPLNRWLFEAEAKGSLSGRGLEILLDASGRLEVNDARS